MFESSVSFPFVGSLIAEQHNVKVSVNDIVIKAVAVALRNVPEANGNDIWTGTLAQTNYFIGGGSGHERC